MTPLDCWQVRQHGCPGRPFHGCRGHPGVVHVGMAPRTAAELLEAPALLAAAGSGVATAGLPGSAGVPAASTADTLVLPYNDVDALEQAFAERGDEIAGVIVESTPANMGVVPPLPGFCSSSNRSEEAESSDIMTRPAGLARRNR